MTADTTTGTPAMQPGTSTVKWTSAIADFYHGDAFNVDKIKAAGIKVVILKESTGINCADPAFVGRAGCTLNAGLILSTYCFGTNAHSGAKQWADYHTRLTAFCSYPGRPRSEDIRLWLDVEPPGPNSPPMSRDKVIEWLEAGESASHLVGLYGYSSLLKNYFHDPSDPIGRFPLWFSCPQEPHKMAHMTPAPWIAQGPRVWQYSTGMHGPTQGPADTVAFPRGVPGLGGCDRSAFQGSDTEMVDWFKGVSRGP